jgi:hypothetical protein
VPDKKKSAKPYQNLKKGEEQLDLSLCLKKSEFTLLRVSSPLVASRSTEEVVREQING